jgi:hypothetical protein
VAQCRSYWVQSGSAYHPDPGWAGKGVALSATVELTDWAPDSTHAQCAAAVIQNGSKWIEATVSDALNLAPMDTRGARDPRIQ